MCYSKAIFSGRPSLATTAKIPLLHVHAHMHTHAYTHMHTYMYTHTLTLRILPSLLPYFPLALVTLQQTV